MEYQQIAAGWFVSCPSTDALLFWWGVLWKGLRRGRKLVFVFGTLLGPEATGPGWCVACKGCVLCSGFGVSGFLAAWFPCVFGCSFVLWWAGGGWCGGVWYGVVV